MNEFIQRLEQIEEKLNHVSNQMQELREAVGGSSYKNSKLPVRELYVHPWYKYKRQELINGGNYTESKRQKNAAA